MKEQLSLTALEKLYARLPGATSLSSGGNRAIFTGQNASHFIHTVKANSPANKQVQTGSRIDFLFSF